MSKIVLTGGGSAGHCVPNVALLPYLKRKFSEIYYIGSFNGIEKSIIETEKIKYYSITTVKLDRTKFFKNFKIPYLLLKGMKEAKKILEKIKPDVVFSKGGYVSVPVVLMAYRQNIPVISHESDYTIGLANKICSKYSKKTLTSFSDTAKTIKNGLYVGSPINDELFNNNYNNSLNFFGLDGKKPIVLITGGSQGAKTINETVRLALNDLLKNFDIIHICGKNNIDKKLNKKGYVQFEYINQMNKAFNIASVCVSRAGSNTVFELLSLKIPSLLIPLPKTSSRGDQILNAEYFENKKLVNVLMQENLNKLTLINGISWINSGEVNNIRITNFSRKISILGMNKSATKLLPKGTTVLAITGATLGQVSLLEIDTCANQSVIGIVEGKYQKEFIYPLINYHIQDLIRKQTGGAQQHINMNDVKSLRIKIPTDTEYEAYKNSVKLLFEN